MKINVKHLATFNLTVMAALIAMGCSSSSDDASSGKAASQSKESSFQISSSSFTEIRPKKRISKENTCYGENLSPPLNWSGVPYGTKSFALIVDDVDHRAGNWTHWVIYNIPSDTRGLATGIPTTTLILPDGTTQGTNDDRLPGYNGPCLPPVFVRWDDGERGAKPEPPHRYVFTLYALDTTLTLGPGATRSKLFDAIQQHIIGQTETKSKSVGITVTDHKKELGMVTSTK